MKRLRIKSALHLRGKICREYPQNSTLFCNYFSEFVLRRLVSKMVSILVSIFRCSQEIRQLLRCKWWRRDTRGRDFRPGICRSQAAATGGIFSSSLSFPRCRKGRDSVVASASEPGVQRPKTFGAGLGWREAQRRGLGTAIVPKRKNRLNRFQSSRVPDSAGGQSSSGIITTMAGCGSSTSSGPQAAINFLSRGRRLSLRT